MVADTDNSYQIKSPNMRFCRFYNQYLFDHNIVIKSLPDNTFDYDKEFNFALNNKYKNNKERVKFIVKMEEIAKEGIIPLKTFSWLKGNYRACYFIWCQIRKTLCISINFYPVKLNSKTGTAYDQLFINPRPTSHKERLEAIIEFFDKWPGTSIEKKKFLLAVTNGWASIYDYPNPFKWIDKNDDMQCEWAWNYLKDRLSVKTSYVFSALQYIKPISNIERYHAIYAAFDDQISLLNERNQISLKMRKTWDQKKNRSKKVKK